MVFMVTKIVGTYLFSINQILYIFYGKGKDLVSNGDVKERARSRRTGGRQVGLVDGVLDLDSRNLGSSLYVSSITWAKPMSFLSTVSSFDNPGTSP